MNVNVAILALRLCNLENGVLALRAFRHVAFVASNRFVFALQGILCCCVILHRKRGRLKPIHRVARRALTPVAVTELPLVRILVAIHALSECNRCLEVASGVTSAALHGLMFS